MAKKIFIIEDEPDILDLLKFITTEEGYDVYGYLSGKKALDGIKSTIPDIILLDVMLMDISGLEICKILKNNPGTWNIPIIILSSRSDEHDILTGYSLGCDDYVSKPFSKQILLAKIKTAIEREERKQINAIKLKDLLIDIDRKEVSIKGKLLDLTAQEFKILFFLASNKGKIFSREQITNAVKDCYYETSERVVDVLISKMRKKLSNYSSCIESVYGMGYRFNECSK